MNPKQSFLSNLLGKVKNLAATRPTTAGAESAPVAAPINQYQLKDRNVALTDDDVNELRHILFGEVSNRAPEKQEFEARVIANTALNRIPQYAEKGKNYALKDVLAQPNQYQAYGGNEYKRLRENKITPVDEPKLKSIDKVLGEIKSGNFADNTEGSVFYSHDPTGRIWLKGGKLYK